jgi:heme oxygenase
LSTPGPAARLSARLRAATRTMHARAERAGAMALLLRGALDGARYARLVRALHALYGTLEGALERHAAHPAIAPLDAAPLHRADALAHDLAALREAGLADARATLPPAALAYVARLAELDAREPVRLVAHAYVRYLGDLAGGQALAPIVERAFGLAHGAATRFYAFGTREAVAARTASLRAALDALPLSPAEADAVVDEALDAFARHVALFEEIAAEGAPSAQIATRDAPSGTRAPAVAPGAPARPRAQRPASPAVAPPAARSPGASSPAASRTRR